MSDWKASTILTGVEFPGATGDFSSTVNFQRRLSYGVWTAPPTHPPPTPMHASTSMCMLKISYTGSHTIVWMHGNTTSTDSAPPPPPPPPPHHLPAFFHHLHQAQWVCNYLHQVKLSYARAWALKQTLILTQAYRPWWNISERRQPWRCQSSGRVGGRWSSASNSACRRSARRAGMPWRRAGPTAAGSCRQIVGSAAATRGITYTGSAPAIVLSSSVSSLCLLSPLSCVN